MYVLGMSLAMTIAMEEINLESQLLAYPPREIVETQIEFATRFYNYLTHDERKGEIELSAWIKGQEAYINSAGTLWLLLRRIQDKTRCLNERLEALSELKEELRTTQGRMPPIVAHWGFREGPPPPPPAPPPNALRSCFTS